MRMIAQSDNKIQLRCHFLMMPPLAPLLWQAVYRMVPAVMNELINSFIHQVPHLPWLSWIAVRHFSTHTDALNNKSNSDDENGRHDRLLHLRSRQPRVRGDASPLFAPHTSRQSEGTLSAATLLFFLFLFLLFPFFSG